LWQTFFRRREYRYMEPLIVLAREGVRNLLDHCARVAKGDNVVVVNERVKIDEALVRLVIDVITERGGAGKVLWVGGDGAPASQTAQTKITFSAEDAEMIAAADKVISSLRDDVFVELSARYKLPLVVTHLFFTIEDMASEHARYHWGMVRAIYDFLETDVFQRGASWRITAPGGTDARGRIDDLSARARYRDEQTAPFLRSFHSGAYRPAAVADTEGAIVCEYTGGASRLPCYDPPVIEVAKNRITEIRGGRHLRRWTDEYRSSLEDKVRRFGEAATVVDSWHGGANPRAEAIPGIVGNGGTRMMHFHLGRTTGKSGDYLAAEISHHTLEVNGEKIYENGKLCILDHPKLKAAADRFCVERP
jgi:hypothetical protein